MQEIVQYVGIAGQILRVTAVIVPLGVRVQILQPLGQARRLVVGRDQVHVFIFRLDDKISGLCVVAEAVDHIIQTAVGKGLAGNGVAACQGKRQVALRVGVQAKHLFALVAHQIGKVRGRYGFSAAAFFHRNGYYCCSHSLVPHFIM